MNIGTPELAIILALALIFFGPKRLPEIGRALGSAIRELKKASHELTSAMKIDIDLDEDQDTSYEHRDAATKG